MAAGLLVLTACTGEPADDSPPPASEASAAAAPVAATSEKTESLLSLRVEGFMQAAGIT
jgi:hypothetical protein